MKRKLFFFIMFSLIAITISSCDISGIIPPIQDDTNTAELTTEEIELIRKWGFGGEYVIRWPDGYVDVYDETHYSRMQEIINEWNSVIGGPVVFRLSNNPNSPVKLYCKSISGYCGNRIVNWNEDYTFSKIDLQINCYEFDCGHPSAKYSLYLFMFKNAVGFKGWTTKGEDVPYGEWTNFTQINDTMKKMVHALHKVPPGYYLFEEQEIEFEGQGTPYVCGGCLISHTSYFDGFNVIDYDDSSYVMIWPKNNEKLPDNIAIILKGKQWIPKSEISYWDKTIKTIASYPNGAANGYEITKVNDRIYIRLSKDYSSAFNAVPWKEVKLYIYSMSSGKLLGHYIFKEDGGIIPRVKSHFGQCVWWAFKRKWETDQKIPPFYPCLGCAGTKKIDSSYIPDDHDVLIYYEDPILPDKLGHYAFVESVKDNGDGTYKIKISQYNFIPESYSEKTISSWKPNQPVNYYIGLDGNIYNFDSYYR